MDLKSLIFKIKLRQAADDYQRAELYKSLGVGMGSQCSILGAVSFGSEPYLIELGDHVRIASGTHFVTHDGGAHVLRGMGLLPNAEAFGKIKIGNNVFIGISTIIMPGVNIGDNVVIGAGSIVTKDIPSNCVAAGVPARVIKTIDAYHEGLKHKVDFTKDMIMDKKRAYLLQKYAREAANQ